jgi:hypothetical protein
LDVVDNEDSFAVARGAGGGVDNVEGAREVEGVVEKQVVAGACEVDGVVDV